jgi:hypothetical protein
MYDNPLENVSTATPPSHIPPCPPTVVDPQGSLVIEENMFPEEPVSPLTPLEPVEPI